MFVSVGDVADQVVRGLELRAEAGERRRERAEEAIRREWHTNTEYPPAEGRAFLRWHRISADAIEAAGACASWARIRRIGHRFAFDPDGEPALVLLCNEEGCAVDIVAVPALDPTRWHLLHGQGVLLANHRDLIRARSFDETLTLSASPLSWLQHGGRGGCVLRPLVEIEDVLLALPRAIAVHEADADFAERLDAALNHSRRLEIGIIPAVPHAG